MMLLEALILLLDFVNGNGSVASTGSFIMLYKLYTIWVVNAFRIEIRDSNTLTECRQFGCANVNTTTPTEGADNAQASVKYTA